MRRRRGPDLAPGTRNDAAHDHLHVMRSRLFHRHHCAFKTAAYCACARQIAVMAPPASGAGRSRSFPTPFKCSGDFCGFAQPVAQADPVALHRAGQRRAAAPPPQAAASMAMTSLFSKEELRALGEANVARLLSAMQVAQATTDDTSGELRVITYKSIALAKGNRAQFLAALKAPSHPQTPPQSVADKAPPGKASRRESRLLDSTTSQELREGSRARVFGELDGVSNYYRQVRVCADCYAVYALLDLARQMTDSGPADGEKALAQHKQQQAKRKQQQQRLERAAVNDLWDDRVARDVHEKERVLLRNTSKRRAETTHAQLAEGIEEETTMGELATPAEASDAILPALIPSSAGANDVGDRRSKPEAPSAGLQHSDRDARSVSMPALQAMESSACARPSSCKATMTTPPSTRAWQQPSDQQLLRSNETFLGMDSYLRGTSTHIERPALTEGELFRQPGGRTRGNNGGPATILLVDSDTAALNELHGFLSGLAGPTLEVEIESVPDAKQALRAAQAFEYDVVLVERELAGDMTGLEFARLLRQAQIKRCLGRASSRPTSIICVSSQTSASDLQLYKDSGMDGCVGKPLSRESLLHTVQAALLARGGPSRGTTASSRVGAGEGGGAVLAATEALAKAKSEQQARQRRRRRRLEASAALAMPGLADMDMRDDCTHGVFQMDAETAIPFCVMGGVRDDDSGTDSASSASATAPDEAFFNLVVVHDLYDTWERLQILLQPLVARYRGRVQVLLWNYPGQAYTAWRRGVVLHNSFHAACLRALLGFVTGASGSARLLRKKPYHLVGIGNGGSIAAAFCCAREPLDAHTRALVLLNGFVHVDAQLAQVLHDSAKVLACTPESRPDLPVYFHARFLFSPAYLARVSTPLALNLYTAVLNPISIEGRQALTLGALAHRDLRPDLRRLRVPLISLCSAQNALLDAGAQAEAVLALANLELVDSVGKVLRYRRAQSSAKGVRGKRPSCVVWLPGGHEALQECKQSVLLLLEQLVTGFHEAHDVPHGTMRARPPSPTRCEDEKPPPKQQQQQQHQQQRSQPASASAAKKTSAHPHNFEDAFIDRVLTTVKDVVPASASANSGRLAANSGRGGATSGRASAASTAAAARPLSREQQPPLDGAQWRVHQQTLEQTAADGRPRPDALRQQQQQRQPAARHEAGRGSHGGSASSSKLVQLTAWDPGTPAFERVSANVVYKPGGGSKIYPLLPEVREYMGWRVRRNQKRLQRMAAMARVIQRAFRAFFARTLSLRLQRERCALHLQRLWRARAARKKFKGLKREDWAARLLQRHWRGKLGRDSFHDRMLRYLAAVDLQRVARGWLARRAVLRRRQRIFQSATLIQRLARRYLARTRMLAQRRRRNAAMAVQRVFRGLLGRRRFERERDKFLLAKTQAQGLAFGKQLLLEYKLFGAKLQSDVALLAREKSAAEAQAEQLVKEICEFDEGVRLLEAELLALGQAEADGAVGGDAAGGAARAPLDEAAKWALREQKMRLDREFSQMLAQIAQRREKLAALEETLARVDQARLRKEEELKALERKLVVLLEQQQQELARIRDKQRTRSQLALDLLPAATTPAGSVAAASSLLPTASGSGAPSAMSPAASAFASSPVVGGASTQSPASGFAPRAVAAGAPPPGFTQQQRQEAAALMESTETMMKFGFMSMSMTYFSSMNMVRAMRKIGAEHLTLDSAAAVSQQRWPENSAVAASAGGSANGSGAAAAMGYFRADVPAGSFPGQQPLQVAGWSVADVGRWLDTLALGQYKRAFADATVDGALLLHLTDDDLRHTLGVEHRLHRKKVLTAVAEMRERESAHMRRLYGARGSGSGNDGDGDAGVGPDASAAAPSVAPVGASVSAQAASASGAADTAGRVAGGAGGPAGGKLVVPFEELCSLARHGKLRQLREALQALPERRFDPLTVAQQFSPGIGTIYDDVLEKSTFHINKGDAKGNSPLLLAAQNNQLKVAQLLLAKGANPDHQNSHGHTAGHYAMAYSFFDLGAWLLDPAKGGGRDDVLNENGLTAYDGLA